MTSLGSEGAMDGSEASAEDAQESGAWDIVMERAVY